MRSHGCHWPTATLSLVLLLASFPATAGEPAGLRGTTLTQAIAALEQRGLLVIYSTDLVKPWMRVASEPTTVEPGRMLSEILAPFNLSARAGPNGVLIIVRITAAQLVEPATAAYRDRNAQDGLTALPAVEKIVVTARPYELIRGIGVPSVSLSSADIANLPDLGDDALRAVGRLPGTTANGLSAETHIRGGEASETLVRFDGLRLYNPFHLRDFQSVFSAVDPSVISSADVYTGGLPANYGDRMSGVIDITSLTPPGPRYHELSLSLFNASALSSGGFANGKGTWLGAVRRSNLDVWYHAFSHESGTPTYVDGFGKLSYPLGENTRLTASTLYIADDVTLAAENGDEQAKAEFADGYAWLRLDRQIGQSLSGSVWLSHTRLASHRDGSSVQSGVSVGSLDDNRRFLIDAVQTEWSWRAADRWLLQFGGEAARAEGHYDFRDAAELAILFDVPGADDRQTRLNNIQIEPRGSRSALYASARFSATPRLTADLGLRWDRQTLDPTRSDPWSPRLGLRYRLGGATDLCVSWARAYQSQNIDELQVSDGVSNFFRPQRTDQLVIGFERQFQNGIALRAEGYEKRIANPRPRFENLLNSLTLLPELKPDRVLIAPARARARGLELLLRYKDPGALTWWFGYSWSSANDEIDGRDVPRSWDQAQAVSAGINWTRNKWDASLALIYRSGWPTTRVTLDASGPTPVAVAGQRNATRLHFFSSADLRVSRRFDLNRSSLSMFFEVSNVLGRANQCCTAYEIDEETRLLDLEPRNYLPLVPSVGVLWQF